MIGNTNFEPQSSEISPVPPKDFILLISRLQKIVLSHYILNFINKNFVEYYFLSSYMNTHIISLLWPPDLHSLK